MTSVARIKAPLCPVGDRFLYGPAVGPRAGLSGGRLGRGEWLGCGERADYHDQAQTADNLHLILSSFEVDVCPHKSGSGPCRYNFLSLLAWRELGQNRAEVSTVYDHGSVMIVNPAMFG